MKKGLIYKYQTISDVELVNTIVSVLDDEYTITINFKIAYIQYRLHLALIYCNRFILTNTCIQYCKKKSSVRFFNTCIEYLS